MQSKLKLSHRLPELKRRDLTNCRIVDVIVRQSGIYVVERVKCLRLELKRHRLGDVRHSELPLLPQREVRPEEPWPTQQTGGDIAILATGGYRKRTCVEPIVKASIRIQWRAIHTVRHLAEISIERCIAGNERRKWQT